MADSFQDLRFCTVYHASKMLDQQPAPGEFKSGNEKQLLVLSLLLRGGLIILFGIIQLVDVGRGIN